MEIDLQSLLRLKPIQGEFVQYFLCQIMVRLTRPLLLPIYFIADKALAWT
jgi:hypothetical protein